MARVKKVDDIRKPRDVERWARHKGASLENGRGSHGKVRGPDGGICVYPRHGNKDFAPGTRVSIIRTLIAIGLGLVVIAFLLYPEEFMSLLGAM